MKLLGREIDPKTGMGWVRLLAQESEDLWHCYNLILAGDRVTATTLRKVLHETSTGSITADRVRMTLCVEVLRVHYDVDAAMLRITGVTARTQSSSDVRHGVHHTLEIELGRPFVLEKDSWDSVALDRLEVACDPARSAEIAAVVLAEGLANVCLITDAMTVVRARIEAPIPRKRRASAASHDKALARFFEAVLQAVLRHIDFSIVKCVVVASPGFVREQFLEYALAEAQQRRELHAVLTNRSKFVLAHSSSGHTLSLQEVIQDPAVAARVADTKASAEVAALREFFDVLKADDTRAVYGIRHIERANELNAIRTLLLSDALFRARDIATRKRYVALVEAVKATGADVRIFSSLHVSGQRAQAYSDLMSFEFFPPFLFPDFLNRFFLGAELAQLTGAAAVLRFPLPGLDDEVTEDCEAAG